jgi:hypothetical protein
MDTLVNTSGFTRKESAMQQFNVDDDIVALVWKLAKPKPFENLTFNGALRRVFHEQLGSTTKEGVLDDLEELLREPTGPKKAPSPSASDWVATVPELQNRKGLSTWKAICDHLKIETAGDSARRKLKNWVKTTRPSWPPVPDID